MDNYLIQICNGDRLVHEYTFATDYLHEAKAIWRDELRRGGSVYLFHRKTEADDWHLISECEREDYV